MGRRGERVVGLLHRVVGAAQARECPRGPRLRHHRGHAVGFGPVEAEAQAAACPASESDCGPGRR